MIIKLNKNQYKLFNSYIKDKNLNNEEVSTSFILLESAEIGLKNPIYNVYINDKEKKEIEKIVDSKVEEIEDKGRTPGFYQSYKSNGGIYKKDSLIDLLIENDVIPKTNKKSKKETKEEANKLKEFYSSMGFNEAKSKDGASWLEILESEEG